MRRPNFFIAGAPKCGTTALFEYLKGHPNIYMPAVIKEPHFFCTDQRKSRYTGSVAEYLDLFREARTHHRAIGEGSTFYLFSDTAVKRIMRFNSQAKFIVMLRNPIDLVHSLHAQHLFGYDEDEPIFERAWHLQHARAEGQFIPKYCSEPKRLQYGMIGKLGEQVDRLLQFTERCQVKYVTYDDFKENTGSIYEDVLSFLGVPIDCRTSFPRFNACKVHRWPWLSRILMKPPYPLDFIKRTVKRTLNLHSKGVGMRFYAKCSRPTKRQPLSVSFRAELIDYYREDIERLEDTIHRDLSHWRQEGSVKNDAA